MSICVSVTRMRDPITAPQLLSQHISTRTFSRSTGTLTRNLTYDMHSSYTYNMQKQPQRRLLAASNPYALLSKAEFIARQTHGCNRNSPFTIHYLCVGFCRSFMIKGHFGLCCFCFEEMICFIGGKSLFLLWFRPQRGKGSRLLSL